MSTVASAVWTVTPFDDPSRRKRLLKVCWIVGIAVSADQTGAAG
jgi:hypothetical protein